MDPVSDELARLDAQLGRHRSWPRVELGISAVLVAIGVLALLGAIALPWVGSATGWNILISGGQPGVALEVFPRLFATTAVLFGVVVSTAALLSRLWALGWACPLGCGFSVVNGVWAVWSRQTAPAGSIGPGPGLILALIVMVLLTAMWVRIAWTRPGGRAGG
ncbi:MAG: hypothetical protein JO100_04680 [Pseudonocardia sp.]|nr:hypothetical protein [Pseudonocardia sp.]